MVFNLALLKSDFPFGNIKEYINSGRIGIVRLIEKGKYTLYGIVSDDDCSDKIDDMVVGNLSSTLDTAYWNDMILSSVTAILGQKVYNKRDVVIPMSIVNSLNTAFSNAVEDDINFTQDELSQALSKLLNLSKFNKFIESCYSNGAWNYYIGVFSVEYTYKTDVDKVTKEITEFFNNNYCNEVCKACDDYLNFVVISQMNCLEDILDTLYEMCYAKYDDIRYFSSPCFEHYEISVKDFVETYRNSGVGELEPRIMSVPFYYYLAETFDWEVKYEYHAHTFKTWFDHVMRIIRPNTLKEVLRSLVDTDNNESGFTFHDNAMFNNYVSAMTDVLKSEPKLLVENY